MWGGTGATFPKLSPSRTGVMLHMIMTTAGRLGIGTTAPQRASAVVGNMASSDMLSAPTTQFDIAHPDPEKPGTGARQKFHLSGRSRDKRIQRDLGEGLGGSDGSW